MANSAAETNRRALALETAARLGLPHDLTLKAARAYLAFLDGTEPADHIWTAASALVGANRGIFGATPTQSKKPVKRKVAAKA